MSSPMTVSISGSFRCRIADVEFSHSYEMTPDSKTTEPKAANEAETESDDSEVRELRALILLINRAKVENNEFLTNLMAQNKDRAAKRAKH